MAAKRTSISRQQRRAERKHRKGLPEQTPIYRRETLDDVLAELDYEHIALGLEPESSSRDSKMLETSQTVELAVKTGASAEENPLAALGLLYDHLYPRNLQENLQTILDKMTGLHYHSAAQNSPLVRKLTFTGSTEVGRRLEQACAATLKRTSMELGGNAPFIVFDDADIDAAVQGALISKYRNSGQTCVCTNRIFVQDTIHDVFVEKLVAATAELKMGNGLDEGVQQGPLVNEKAVEDVDRLVRLSTDAGAQVALGGARSDLGPCYYQPTVLTGVTSDMAVFRNEIFGPVAPVMSFADEAEAIALANDTEFGLASYFYTRDIGRVWRVSEALDYGMVGVNEGIISNEMAPFGGVKASGSGREGSKYGIDDYLEIKYILMGGLDR